MDCMAERLSLSLLNHWAPRGDRKGFFHLPPCMTLPTPLPQPTVLPRLALVAGLPRNTVGAPVP